MLNLSDEWWFLGQAVHWIAWRDDAFNGDGPLQGSDAAATLAAERLALISEKWELAERDLFSKLYDGGVVAIGLTHSKAAEEIPREAWASAGTDFFESGAMVSYGGQSGGDLGGRLEYQGRVWDDLHLRRSDVVLLWPQPKHEQHRSPPAFQHVEEAVILSFLEEEIAKAGGFLAQNTGAKIVREKFPDFDRDRARELTKGLTGNTKQGPRGPRKTRAG